MISSYEYRLRARASLGGSIFSSIWLLAVIAIVIMASVTSVFSATLVGAFLVMGPLNIGLASIFLGISRGKGEVDLADMIKGFTSDFTGNLLIGLVSSIKIFLWSLLLVIPGIAKAYSYSMIYYIKNDHPHYTWRECLAESERMMVGNRWRLFCLDFSFLGWIIVGSLCFGIGSLWVGAYMEAAHAQFYQDLA